jgi:hypothetical protein
MDMHASLSPVLRSDGEVCHAPVAALLQALDVLLLELRDGLGLGALEAKGERAVQVPAGVGDDLLAADAEGAEASVVGAVGQRRAPRGVSARGMMRAPSEDFRRPDRHRVFLSLVSGRVPISRMGPPECRLVCLNRDYRLASTGRVRGEGRPVDGRPTSTGIQPEDEVGPFMANGSAKFQKRGSAALAAPASEGLLCDAQVGRSCDRVEDDLGFMHR